MCANVRYDRAGVTIDNAAAIAPEDYSRGQASADLSRRSPKDGGGRHERSPRSAGPGFLLRRAVERMRNGMALQLPLSG